MFSNGVTLAGGVITVPAGVTSFTVTVPTIDDTLAEPGANETLPLTIGGVTGNGTIIDNEGAPSVASVTSDTQTEGTSLVHTVTLSGASASDTTYSFSLAGVSATAGTDFTNAPVFSNGVTLAGGVITVPAGVTSFTVSVPTLQDTTDEPAETTAIVVGGVSATGTINDDDAPPTITTVEPGAPGAGDDAVVEGTSLVYTVSLSNPSSVATTYPFSLGGGTAGAGDFTNAPVFSNGVTLAGGVITVPAGVTSFTVSVPTIDDTLAEPGANETLPLTIGGVTGNGAIIDNEGAPSVASVTSDTQTEGTSLVHTVTLSGASASDTTYSFSLAGVSATAGTDFTNAPVFSDGVTLAGGVITVPAGVTSFTVSVPTLQDTTDEPAETTAIVVGGVSATGTINDDDAPPTITTVEPGAPGAGDDAVVEGTSLVYTVSLSNPSSVATTYPFSLGGGTAGAGDFTNAPVFSNGVTLAGGVITVPAGVTSFTVSVPTIDDTLAEPGANETLPLTIGGVTGNGAIIDNEGAPSVASVTSDTQTEGTSLVHTVTLSGASASDTTYSFSLAGVSATAGTDFTNAPVFSDGVTLAGGVITVPAGVTSFTVSVPTLQDTTDEPAETTAIVVGGVSATGTINDDDAPPTITSVEPGAPGAGDDAVVEGTSLVYTVSLSNPSSVATTYPFSLGGGTAGAGDFTNAPVFSNGVTLAGGVITVPAGVTSFTVSVPTIDDTLAEPGANETLPLTIGGVTGNGAIIDNEGAPSVASVTSDTQTEGTSLVHTVTLSGASASDTTYSFSLAGVSATAGTDFTNAPVFSDGVTLAGGVITVPAGVTSFTVSVPTLQDTTDEPAETTAIVVGGVSATRHHQ